MRSTLLHCLAPAILIVLIVMCSGGVVSATSITETHGHAAPPPRTVYVALGASDTVGVGAANPARDNWTAQLARRLPSGSRYVNLGHSGATLSDALAAELPAALKDHPTLVTVWLAVNDINALVSPDDYAAQLDRLLAALRKAGARVYVGNVPDLTLVPAYTNAGVSKDDVNQIVHMYNTIIATACARRGATLVDLYAASKPVLHNLKNVGSDGFHPSTRGYTLLANLFYRVMHRDHVI